MSNVGRFVWYELLTTDPKAAVAFYTEIVGWKTQAWEGGDYVMWVSGQGPIGGTTTLPEHAKKAGAPPHWMANVEVADVDATIAQAKKLGAQVRVEPADIPNVGRFAVVSDPQGVALSVFKPASAMALHDASKPGEFCWNELLIDDHEKAFAFYAALFGWEKSSDFDMGPMGKYLIYKKDGVDLGGMMSRKSIPAPAAWLYYAQVTQLDATIERAKAKGAKLLHGPHEVPGGARVAQLMDPQGAAFALHEPPKAS